MLSLGSGAQIQSGAEKERVADSYLVPSARNLKRFVRNVVREYFFGLVRGVAHFVILRLLLHPHNGSRQ